MIIINLESTISIVRYRNTVRQKSYEAVVRNKDLPAIQVQSGSAR